MVATVRKTSVVPLFAAIEAVSNVQVVPRGQPKNVSATAFGKVPDEGVTVMSYLAEFPAIIVAGPEFDREKLNALCTTSVNSAVALTKPDVPVTAILEYVPGGVPDCVARVSTTLVAPLPPPTVAGLNEQLLCTGSPEHESVTGSGKLPTEGATFKA